MALEKVGSKALAVVEADKKTIILPKAKKKVLDEDAYTEVSSSFRSPSYWPTQLRELRPEIYRMRKVECPNFQCQQYVHNNSK